MSTAPFGCREDRSRAEIAEAAEKKGGDTFLSLGASYESLLTPGDSPMSSGASRRLASKRG
jgi:hypothetical protein